MKLKYTFMALAVMTGVSQAATVTWGSAYNFDQTDQSLWQNQFSSSTNGGTASLGTDTVVQAVSIGDSSAANPVINTIAFTEVAGSTDFWGNTGINANIDEVLSGHNSNPILSLTGLTDGRLYQIQLIGIHDTRGSGINERQYQVDNGAGDYTGAPILTRGAYGNNSFTPIADSFGTVVGTFVAVGTTQTITLRSNEADGNVADDPDPGLGGYILIQSVPEPSTTALLGLGGLALILRRCK